MLGNVWEWTSTPFRSAQAMYVLRGGSWIDTADGSANHRARVTTRLVITSSYRLFLTILFITTDLQYCAKAMAHGM